MAVIALAFPKEDFDRFSAAGLTSLVFAHVEIDGLSTLLLNGKPAKVNTALKSEGLSFNYAVFPYGEGLVAREQGQQRYGHDGDEMWSSITPNKELADVLYRTVSNLAHVDKYRLCLVASGNASWDNRVENGQMYKMRCLLSE